MALLEPFLARNPPGDDNSTVTSHFRWSLDSPESVEPSRVASTLALQHPLRPMYGSASSRVAWLAQHSAALAPLGAMALPPDVHLLSLNEWNASFVLLRPACGCSTSARSAAREAAAAWASRRRST